MNRLFLKSSSGGQRRASRQLGMLCVLPLSYSVSAAADDTSEIAKQAQNPIASVISVPFQNSTTFDVGENSIVQDSLLIEPVVPFKLTSDCKLIKRTIIPVT
jgi:hypothetical protein